MVEGPFGPMDLGRHHLQGREILRVLLHILKGIEVRQGVLQASNHALGGGAEQMTLPHDDEPSFPQMAQEERVAAFVVHPRQHEPHGPDGIVPGDEPVALPEGLQAVQTDQHDGPLGMPQLLLKMLKDEGPAGQSGQAVEGRLHLGSAQDVLDPGPQLLQAERLGDVIVGSQLQTGQRSSRSRFSVRKITGISRVLRWARS